MRLLPLVLVLAAASALTACGTADSGTPGWSLVATGIVGPPSPPGPRTCTSSAT